MVLAQESVQEEKVRDVVLDVRDLRTYLYTRWGVTKAVDGVSFQVHEGETLGIVGESGCGKSMTALSLLRLAPKPAARTVSGEILLDGVDLLKLSESEMRDARGKKISMILQDPQTSLDPLFNVGDQLIETLMAHQKKFEPRKTLWERAVDALRQVRVADPERRMSAYPHEMSGGMKQRVVGATALLSRPRVLIADEPTTALDVTIQAQYLRLLKRVQAETGVSIIFITHDMGVVAKMCDRAVVMYAGRIVEHGTVRELFNSPTHPYTQALLASVPKIDQKVERLYSIEGQPPALFDLPEGCRFAPRCQYADDRCRAEYPPTYTSPTGHDVTCWRQEDVWPATL
jgi:oligopeptide/dipeptide ABC transporter ATP-binding protein